MNFMLKTIQGIRNTAGFKAFEQMVRDSYAAMQEFLGARAAEPAMKTAPIATRPTQPHGP